MAGTVRGKETGMLAGRAAMMMENAGKARTLLIVTSMTRRDPILCRYEHQAQTSQEQKKTAAPHHDSPADSALSRNFLQPRKRATAIAREIQQIYTTEWGVTP